MPFRQHQRFIPGPPGMGEPFNPWDESPVIPPGFDFPRGGPDIDPGFGETPDELIEAIMRLLGKRNPGPVAPRFVNPPRPFVEAPVVGGQNPQVYKGALAKIKAGMGREPMSLRGADMLSGFTGPRNPQGPRPEPRQPMAAPPMAPPGQMAAPRGGGFMVGEPETDFDPRESPDFWGNWPYPKAKRPPTNAF